MTNHHEWRESRAILEAYLIDALGITLETYKRSLGEHGSGDDSKKLADWQKTAKLTLSHLDLLLRIIARLTGQDSAADSDAEDDFEDRAHREVSAYDASHSHD